MCPLTIACDILDERGRSVYLASILVSRWEWLGSDSKDEKRRLGQVQGLTAP